MPRHNHRKLLGRKVRKLREAAGASQEGFALSAGIDRSYYAKVERGEVNVSVDMLAAIARALKRPIAELFDWE